MIYAYAVSEIKRKKARSSESGCMSKIKHTLSAKEKAMLDKTENPES